MKTEHTEHTIVFVRHGQSEWNLQNRFTGWTDVDLTDHGRQEARTGGKLLKENGFLFDKAYTSVLKRAILTLNIIQDEMDLDWIPVVRAWQLNERHYGALQGLNKGETAVKYGEAQVKIWRRSYDVPPPTLDISDARHPIFDSRYTGISVDQLPSTESLKITLERVLPYWQEKISPEIASGKQLLVVAHGNSIRAIVKYLDNISETEITELNIPTGIPLVYKLDEELRPISHYYLADEETVRKAAEAVANQGKAK